jgi:transcriptional regulator of acetoin/glycerol metabolism
VGQRELNEARDALDDKLPLAYDEIDFLYSIVGPIGYTVTLADRAGLTLAERADRHSGRYTSMDRPGTVWTERYAGTNGVGTCLHSARMTSVFLDEHYFNDFIEMSCVAAPLMAPDCTVWGALNISVHNPRLQMETHALAFEVIKKSADRLAEAIFRKQYANSTILKLWVEEGQKSLLAVNEDHVVVAADSAARALLDLPRTALAPISLWKLFEEDRKALKAGDDGLAPIELRCRNGMRARGLVSSRARPKLISAPSTRRAEAPSSRMGGGRAIPLDAWAGREPRMLESVRILRKLMHTGLPVLVLGETGVGKDTLARAIHAESSRAAAPFVALNCGAMPENLIESELFGYAGGAFTGARKEGSTGRFVQADGGTLFLDEIGDMPHQLQTRLLRVLETGEVSPLGAGKTQCVDVQVIAATNQKLERQVEAGTFREDLYYRLAGIVIDVPSLRDRTDLDAVIDRCVAQTAGRNGPKLSAEARQALRQHNWPGNLRELYLVITRAAALATNGVIETSDLLLRRTKAGAAPEVRTLSPRLPPAEDWSRLPAPTETGGNAEPDAIIAAIRDAGGDINKAACTLGMSRATLYRRIKQHGLSRRH